MDGTGFSIVNIFTYPGASLRSFAEVKILLKLSRVSYQSVR